MIASPDGRDGSVLIHQNAYIFASILGESDSLNYDIAEGRTAYVHVIRGKLEVNGQKLDSGDALKITETSHLEINHGVDVEFLLFDLPY